MTITEELVEVVELECRSAQLLEVDFPKRLIELVVMPYETESAVEHRGRLISEVVSRGAFDGIQGRRRLPVRVNRDHELRRTVGRAVRFDPDRPEGLVAEVHISGTHEGDETLTLARDGCLDASAGFSLKTAPDSRRPLPDAEVWETRSRRRLNHLWLHHIAMTPDPAYPEARVLAVRHSVIPPAPIPEPGSDTPNLELARAIRFELRYGAG